MTKEELADLVRYTYTAYNKEIPHHQEKTIYTTWWTLIGHYPQTSIHDTITELATQTFMPTPGQIKKTYLNNNHPNPPPTPAETWNYLQQLIQNLNTGVHQPQTPTKTPNENEAIKPHKNTQQKHPTKTPEKKHPTKTPNQKHNPPQKNPTNTHPCIQQLHQQYGKTIYNLTTNGDRTHLLTTYNEITTQWYKTNT